MATDATGTPTSLGIPTFNTAVDAPSGLGGNAQMSAIDALFVSRKHAPTRQIFTSGSGTYTTPANVIAIIVECIGGGGGGGSAPITTSAQSGAGGGGGGGAYSASLLAPPLATYAYVVGAGGAAGLIGNVSTFGTGPLISAAPGGAGAGGAATAGPVMQGLGGGGGIGTLGDIQMGGESGTVGFVLAANQPAAGNGGCAARGGGGGHAPQGSTAGVIGVAPGGGGSGASANISNAGVLNGGAGANGIIIVWEFYG